MKLLPIIILIILFSSCIKKIDYLDTSQDSRLVVSCLFTPDSLFKVYVSSTGGIFDEIYQIEDASVEIWTKNIPVEQLQYVDSFYISENLKPVVGQEYTLKVSASGFPDIQATDKIPNSAEIVETFYNSNTEYDYYYNLPYTGTSITFIDNKNVNNYYEIIYLEQYFSNVEYDTLLVVDSNSANLSYIQTSTDDIVVLDEKLQKYRQNLIYFSDKKILSEEYTMNIKLISEILLDDFRRNLFVDFRTISYNYYMYRKKLAEHLYGQATPIDNLNLDFIFSSEPTEMYSNVIGGYGIFAGYSQNFQQVFVKKEEN